MDSIYIFLAKYLIFIIALAVIYYGYRLSGDKRIKFALLVISSGIIAVILAKIASALYYHPRPFVSSGIKPLIDHSADNGFPSEHATYSMVLALALYSWNKKYGYYLVTASLLVGFGRIMVHVHSLLDIVGGVAVAAASVWLAQILVTKYFDSFKKALSK